MVISPILYFFQQFFDAEPVFLVLQARRCEPIGNTSSALATTCWLAPAQSV